MEAKTKTQQTFASNQATTSCSNMLVHLNSGRLNRLCLEALMPAEVIRGENHISQRWLASCQYRICPTTFIYFPWAPCPVTSCCAMAPAASQRLRRCKVAELTRHMFSRSAAGTSGCVCLSECLRSLAASPGSSSQSVLWPEADFPPKKEKSKMRVCVYIWLLQKSTLKVWNY